MYWIEINQSFIHTDAKKPKADSQWFWFNLPKTDIAKHFKKIHKIGANRSIARQISMIHIKSNIECLVLFQNNDKAIKATEIIRGFASDSLCKKLRINISNFRNILIQKRNFKFQAMIWLHSFECGKLCWANKVFITFFSISVLFPRTNNMFPRILIFFLIFIQRYCAYWVQYLHNLCPGDIFSANELRLSHCWSTNGQSEPSQMYRNTRL